MVRENGFPCAAGPLADDNCGFRLEQAAAGRQEGVRMTSAYIQTDAIPPEI